MLVSTWNKHLDKLEAQYNFWVQANKKATTIAERIQIINAQANLMKALVTMKKYKDLGLVEDPIKNITPETKEVSDE